MGIQVRKNDHKDWDLWLYGATFAHNVTVLQGTEGLTPFFLEFGREPVFPEAVGVQPHPLLPLTKENYGKALLQRIDQGYREWRDLNHEQREIQKRSHDVGVTPREFSRGDHVLLKRTPKKQPKLVTKWLDRALGPYRVVERVQGTENKDLYVLEDVHSGARTAPTNVDRIVPLDWYGDLLADQAAERSVSLDPPEAPSSDQPRRRMTKKGPLS